MKKTHTTESLTKIMYLVRNGCKMIRLNIYKKDHPDSMMKHSITFKSPDMEELLERWDRMSAKEKRHTREDIRLYIAKERELARRQFADKAVKA